MESQQQTDKDENLFTKDDSHDFSSGPLVAAPDDEDTEEEMDEEERALDDKAEDD